MAWHVIMWQTAVHLLPNFHFIPHRIKVITPTCGILGPPRCGNLPKKMNRNEKITKQVVLKTFAVYFIFFWRKKMVIFSAHAHLILIIILFRKWNATYNLYYIRNHFHIFFLKNTHLLCEKRREMTGGHGLWEGFKHAIYTAL